MGSGSEKGLPRACDAEDPTNQKKCPLDPYIIIHSKSTFADQQTLKLQEAPDMVPVGELPRHMLLSADRYLTGRVVPGSRVIASGIYSQFQSAKQKSAGTAALRQPYLRLVHLELMSPAGTGGATPFGAQYTSEQEEEFEQMARSDGFYERFAKSIAPSIYGSLGVFITENTRMFSLMLNRYKEGHYLSALWRIKESPSRWYAFKRRH